MMTIDDFIAYHIMGIIDNIPVEKKIENLTKETRRKFGMTDMTNDDILKYIKEECGYCDCCGTFLFRTELETDYVYDALVCEVCSTEFYEHDSDDDCLVW
ncbi:MAG: hypothetical protein ACRC5M_00680 [Anaeroplasmataceae bacterium]